MLQFYKVLQIFVKFPSQLYIQSLIGYFPPSFIRTIRRYSFQFSNSRHAGIISRGCNSYPNSYSFGKCDRAHSSDFRVRYWWPYRLLIWNCTKLKWTKACKSFLLLLILVDHLIYSSMSVLFILTLASVNKPTAGRIWGYVLEEFLSEKSENSFGHCPLYFVPRVSLVLVYFFTWNHELSRTTPSASGYDFICFHLFLL